MGDELIADDDEDGLRAQLEPAQEGVDGDRAVDLDLASGVAEQDLHRVKVTGLLRPDDLADLEGLAGLQLDTQDVFALADGPVQDAQPGRGGTGVEPTA